MFLDPYLSQLLSPQEEELALRFLKTEACLQDMENESRLRKDHSDSSRSSSSENQSNEQGSSSGKHGTSPPILSQPINSQTPARQPTSHGTGMNKPNGNQSDVSMQEQLDGISPEENVCSVPKRLRLFKFVKVPSADRRDETEPDVNSFGARFDRDIKKMQNLFRPLR
jgi:hypothetical protein